MDSHAKERLGAVDIARPCRDGLIHDEPADRGAPAPDEVNEECAIAGGVSQGVGAESRENGRDLRSGFDLALVGTGQISHAVLGENAQANRAAWRGRAPS